MDPHPPVRTHATAEPGEPQHHVVEIWLHGELDLTHRDDLDRMLADIDGCCAPQIVVHAEDLEFLASVGVRALGRLVTLARSRGGRVVVTGCSDFVRRVLTVSGLAADLTFR